MDPVSKICLLCGSDLKEKPSYTAFQTDLTTSDVKVITKLTLIVRIPAAPTELVSDLICEPCLHLVEEFDTLEQKLMSIGKNITDKFYETNIKHVKKDVCKSENDEDSGGPGHASDEDEESEDEPLVNYKHGEDSGGDSFIMSTSNTDTSQSDIETRMSCVICGAVCPTKEDLDRHISAVHSNSPFNVESEEINPDVTNTLANYSVVMKEKRNPVIPCTVCGKVLSEMSIGRHMVVLHGIKPFRCKMCGQQFEGKQLLRDHVLSHYGKDGRIGDSNTSDILEKGASPRKFPICQCKLCGKYMSSMSLNRHWVLVHNIKPFCCSFCGEAFTGKQQLKTHCLALHQDIGPLEAYTDATGASVKKRKLPVQKCDLCDAYISLPSLKRHMKNMHDIPTEANQHDSQQYFKCEMK